MRGDPETAPETAQDTRRGAAPADEAYLRRVGERVRLGRARRGMSRKVLSRASGVSERYLAELERGAGNASLLVLRQIAQALSIEAAALVSDEPERPLDLTLAMHQLQRLSPGELAEARELIARRFGIGRRRCARAHRPGGPARRRQDHARPARGGGSGGALHRARPRDRAGLRHGAVGDFRHAGPGDVPPARAAVPADRRATLRARGDRHRRQPGHRARHLRSAAVDLLRGLAQSQPRSAHGPRHRPGRLAADGRQSAGHGRSASHPGEPHRRSMRKPAPK